MALKNLTAFCDTQHHLRVVARPAGGVRLSPEAKAGDIQIINKRINHPNRAVFGNVVVNAFGKIATWDGTSLSLQGEPYSSYSLYLANTLLYPSVGQVVPACDTE